MQTVHNVRNGSIRQTMALLELYMIEFDAGPQNMCKILV